MLEQCQYPVPVHYGSQGMPIAYIHYNYRAAGTTCQRPANGSRPRIHEKYIVPVLFQGLHDCLHPGKVGRYLVQMGEPLQFAALLQQLPEMPEPEHTIAHVGSFTVILYRHCKVPGQLCLEQLQCCAKGISIHITHLNWLCPHGCRVLVGQQRHTHLRHFLQVVVYGQGSIRSGINFQPCLDMFTYSLA